MDIPMVIDTLTRRETVAKIHDSYLAIRAWMGDAGLELALEKTEVVVITAAFFF